MQNCKLKHVVYITKEERLKKVVVFLLVFVLLCAFAFNYSSFSRIFNMYYYDKYLESLYQIKTSQGIEGLQKINSDCFAYMECEDVEVRLPVVETSNKKEEDYYLNHDFKRKKNELGTPYQRSDGQIGVSDNTIFEGHSAFTETVFQSTKSQSIFGKFNQYLYTSSAYNYKITVETVSEMYEYQVMSVILFNTKSSDISRELHLYSTTHFSSQSDFDKFCQYANACAHVNGPATATYGDRFLTIFTCSTSNLDYRVMVIAKETSKISKTA